jgi:hypothetical protein
MQTLDNQQFKVGQTVTIVATEHGFHPYHAQQGKVCLYRGWQNAGATRPLVGWRGPAGHIYEVETSEGECLFHETELIHRCDKTRG